MLYPGITLIPFLYILNNFAGAKLWTEVQKITMDKSLAVTKSIKMMLFSIHLQIFSLCILFYGFYLTVLDQMQMIGYSSWNIFLNVWVIPIILN